MQPVLLVVVMEALEEELEVLSHLQLQQEEVLLQLDKVMMVVVL
jgi:hypothetical protein